MSVIHTMETFILPPSFLMMHSSSLSFQKTHLFHAGSYILEFILLVLLLSGVAIYGYLSLKQNVKRTKSNSETRKSHSPSPKVLAKIKEATAAAATASTSSKLASEKPSPKVVTTTATSVALTNKKRASSNSPQKSATGSPSKRKAGSRVTSLQQPRLNKNEIQRHSPSDSEKVCVRDNTNTKSKDNSTADILAVSEVANKPLPNKELPKKNVASNGNTETPTVPTRNTNKNRSRNSRRRNKNQHVQPAKDSEAEQMNFEYLYIEPQLPFMAPQAAPVFLDAFTYEEEQLYIQLHEFLVPYFTLPYHGYPFMLFHYPNYGVFFNSTPHDLRLLKKHQPEWVFENYLTEFQPFEIIEQCLNDDNLNQYFLNANVRDGRECCRCKKNFFLSKNEQCWYHIGRLVHEFGEARYGCCKAAKNSTGCTSANDHVWNGLIPGINGPIDGFVITESPSYPLMKHRVVAIDCEMCFTIRGLELTRVTILDVRGNSIYDTLVMPENPIIDYNTPFSGITKESMEIPGATKSLQQVQQDILQLIDNSTIIIGHGLENDLRALKLVHYTVVDTALIFAGGKRYSLKHLAQCFLHQTIQDSDTGHDSVEDATACLEVAKYLVRNYGNSSLPRQTP